MKSLLFKEKKIFLKKFFFRNKFYNFLFDKNKVFMKFWVKNIFCFSLFFEKKFVIYNGNKFISLYFKKLMLNSYLGKYILTKKIGSNIHKKKKKRKIKK